MPADRDIDWTRHATRPRPFHGLRPAPWLLYRAVWFLWRTIDLLVFRTRDTGLDKVPADGPLLLLGNHVGLLDPFWVAGRLWRPSRFMAATTALRIPILGPLLAGLGAFPKMKGVKDRESMALLSGYLQQGLVVTLFPEGERTWDGRLQAILPGTGRLIHRERVPVLFARLRNGYLLNPRWARYPRWIPLDIEFEGPHSYPEDWTPEQITEDVARRLRVEPQRGSRKPVGGIRLAAGLDVLLWACPVCLVQGTLGVVPGDQDRVACSACGAHWRMDLDTNLHGEGGTADLSLAQAVDALAAHFGNPPVLDRDAYVASGDVATAREVRILAFDGDRKMVELVRGALRVRAGGIDVLDPQGASAWSLPFGDVATISIDVGSQILIRRRTDRREGEVFKLVVTGESPLKWSDLLRAWHREAQR